MNSLEVADQTKKALSGRISDRDVRILEKLCHLGYLTARHIQEDEFKGSDIKVVNNRLSKLQHYNLIRRLRRRDERGSIVYVPVLKEVRSIVSDSAFEKADRAFQVRPWFTGSAPHDDLVRSVALNAFKQIPELDLSLDYHLSSNISQTGALWDQEFRKLPDLCFKLSTGENVAIEVELSTKSKLRYEQIINRYLTIENCMVIYFVKDLSTFELMVRVLKSLGLISKAAPFPILFEMLHHANSESALPILVAEGIGKLKAWNSSRSHGGGMTLGRPVGLSELIK